MNMYNDEQNLYHYTYRKDGSESAPRTENHAAPQEPIHPQSAGPQGPVQEMKPVKKNRMGLKIIALALCCALLGGAVGGGVVYGISGSGSNSSINVSNRRPPRWPLKPWTARRR